MALNQGSKSDGEEKDLFVILNDVKKELDDLLASGHGDLSFDYERKEEHVDILFIQIRENEC